MEFKKQFKEELIKEDAWISLTNEQRESVVNIAEQQLQLYIRKLLIDFMTKTQGNLIWGWNIGGGENLVDEYLKGNL